ncbi:MAG: DEAD/DEAH box helicase, partial [Chloroflexi bacterium]|nr:DEAD/DEAH box helicase [Chloroflexota bacterium]
KDVEHILGATPQERQTALFSATTPRWVHDVSSKYLSEPVVIELGADEESKPDIDHVIYEIGGQDKFHVLQRLLDETATGSTLVFGRTKHGVRKLGQRLERSGYHVGVLHGNLSQPQRERVLRQFTAKEIPVLLATNVAARGLDVDHIERVINYELPETHDLFTHRVGRTARMGRSGSAITLLAPADMAKWDKLERGLGRKFLRRTLDGQPVPERTGTNKNGNRNENGNGSGVRRTRRQFHQGSPRPAPRADVAGRSRRPSQRRRRPANQPLRA